MQPRIFRVIVPVSDIEQAARFYQAVLRTEGTRVSAGRHYFNCDGTILACFDPRADGDEFDAQPNPDHLYIAVENVEATLAAARTAGATFAEGQVHGDPAGEIATRPWGERSFYISDPFGNKLCFVDHTTIFMG